VLTLADAVGFVYPKFAETRRLTTVPVSASVALTVTPIVRAPGDVGIGTVCVSVAEGWVTLSPSPKSKVYESAGCHPVADASTVTPSRPVVVVVAATANGSWN
jgi:hypothetical protein